MPDLNKSEAVRDYFKSNPKATTQEVVDALAKQGITIAAGLVRNIKSKHNKSALPRKRPKSLPTPK